MYRLDMIKIYFALKKCFFMPRNGIKIFFFFLNSTFYRIFLHASNS